MLKNYFLGKGGMNSSFILNMNLESSLRFKWASLLILEGCFGFKLFTYQKENIPSIDDFCDFA